MKGAFFDGMCKGLAGAGMLGTIVLVGNGLYARLTTRLEEIPVAKLVWKEDGASRLVHSAQGQTYCVSSSILLGRSDHDADMLFGSLSANHTYSAYVYGLDYPALGLYPNIVSVRSAFAPALR